LCTGLGDRPIALILDAGPLYAYVDADDAQRLDATEVATLDRRHFSVVRPRHEVAFRLLP
jgi:hypothetical protein